MIRTYSELSLLQTFEERFKYLYVGGRVGEDTFGHDRYLNQYLYQRSYEWKRARQFVIARDMGCDLGVAGHEIFGRVMIHHMNPLTKEQVLRMDPIIFDPEFLITTAFKTHQDLHFGNMEARNSLPIERNPGDTILW